MGVGRLDRIAAKARRPLRVQESVVVVEELPYNHGRSYRSEAKMNKCTLVYWKGEKFWLGKILEHPEIMTQGETLEELEKNIKDAYRLMVMEDVPPNYQVKEIAL